MHTVAEMMTTDVRTARTSDALGPVRDMMLEEKIGAVPVLDENDRLAGIVTSTDLVDDWHAEASVDGLMSDHVKTVRGTTEITTAAFMMVDNRIHHLVVIDDHGAVVGIVSSWDLLADLALAAQAAVDVGRAGCER